MKPQILRQQLVVTELLFEAASDPRLLRSALYAMTVLIGADVGVLSIGRPGSGNRQLITTECPEGGVSPPVASLRTFACMEPYRRGVQKRQSGRFYGNQDLLPREHLESSGFYRNWLSHAPLANGCIGYVEVGGGELCTLGFGSFGASGGSRPFDPAAVVALEQLLPHVQRVCVLHRQLDALRAVNAATMNRFERYHVGVVVVDDEGCVVFSNEAAQRLLQRGDGLRLRGNNLDVRDGTESEVLMRAIRDVLQSDLPDASFGPQLFPVTREQGAPLSVAICPYRSGTGGARDTAVLMIYDPDRPPVERGSVLQSVYALSERESDLTCALAAGESLEDFAVRSGRTIDSVRSQLKRIFRKTGTARQTELVKLVLSGPAAMVQ